MVMKTDPKNSDYEMESGASRNFEPWRASDEQKATAKRQREEEEMGDAMRALENRTLDSKMEMDILAALDEMKSMRARQATLDPAAVLEVLQRSAGGAGGSGGGVLADPKQLTEEDEELIKKIVFRKSEKFVKRIDSDEEDEGGEGDGAEASNKDQQGGVKRARIAANGDEAEAGGGDVPGDNDKATVPIKDAGKVPLASRDSRGNSGAEIAGGNADGSGGSSAGGLQRDDEEKGKAALTNLFSTYGSDDDDEDE
ncbi:unnamed protein product [Closterium sp. Naga37s-1]|nr:unnamed protein product [Closterium sp. Naga37s-1]CAI5528302.1 unnamed protein product [Closterium sp. Naga37s-1]